MTTYRTLEVDGSEIFYREAGDPAAPTLLLLEGFPSSSAQYEQLISRLADRFHLVAPDYPGFGRSPALAGETTFDRLAAVIDRFTEATGLERFSVYMFDFGAPVGFRLATRHPERIEALVIQNGNAYEEGLGPKMQGLQPYMDLPGRDRVMLDLLFDYQSNVALYPRWHEYLRSQEPPALLAWGRNDAFFPEVGAHAYLQDLPAAELHLLDTGHFATATHSDEIADLVGAFMARHVGSAR